MTPTIRCGYKTEGGDRCVLTDEHDGAHCVDGVSDHYADDPDVPYLMCSCGTCRKARETVQI